MNRFNLKKIKIFNCQLIFQIFSLFFFTFFNSWIRIRIRNADPDPGDQINEDPDPHHWTIHSASPDQPASQPAAPVSIAQQIPRPAPPVARNRVGDLQYRIYIFGFYKQPPPLQRPNTQQKGKYIVNKKYMGGKKRVKNY